MNWQRRWDPFRDLQREMGRLFETFEPFQPWLVTRQFPAINLYDASDRYVLTAQLPGVTSEDLDLSITGETLTLRGERKRPEGVSDESYRRQERQTGRWTRTVTLPDRVDGAADRRLRSRHPDRDAAQIRECQAQAHHRVGLAFGLIGDLLPPRGA